MSQPYVGEIRIVGFNFAPVGWAFCDGSLLPISQNTVLFDLIGTTYGGDGVNTFALPDLRDRVPVHQGTGFTIGQSAGETTVTLTTQQLPAHTHTAQGAAGGPEGNPVGQTWGDQGQGGAAVYGAPGAPIAMSAQALTQAGGGQPHSNQSPYLGLNFIISLLGVFPSQN